MWKIILSSYMGIYTLLRILPQGIFVSSPHLFSCPKHISVWTHGYLFICYQQYYFINFCFFKWFELCSLGSLSIVWPWHILDCLFYILNIPLLSDTIRYFNIILYNASSLLELFISLKKPDSTYGRRVLEDLGAGGLFVSVVMLNS